MTTGQSWLRRPLFWVGMLVTVLSVVLLAFLVNIPDLIAKLRQTDLRFVAASILIMCLSAYIRSVRWEAILGLRGEFWNVFHAENIGDMLNSILPFRAGDAARVYVLSRAPTTQTISPVEAFSTVVLIRIADTFAAVVLLGLVLPVLDIPEAFRTAGYGVLVLATIAFVVLLIGAFARPWLLQLATIILSRLLPQNSASRLLSWIDSFLEGLSRLRNIRSIVSLIGLTALLWASYVAFYTLSLAAFAAVPILAWGTLACCAASFSLAIPSSPGGLGVLQATVALAMSPYLTPDTAAAYAIMVYATELVPILVFGAYSLAITGTSIRRITSEMSHQPEVGVG